jgi:hypothetical protein
MKEAGLYGLEERGNYFGQRADENRFADVESEGTHKEFKTEQQFRLEMADCIVAEMMAAKHGEKLSNWFDDLDSFDTPVLPEMIYRAIEMTEQQVQDALNRLGEIAEEMRLAGFAQPLVFNAIEAATPLAYRKLWNMKAKAEQGAKPKSKVGRGCSLYRPTKEVIEKYAVEPSNPPNYVR